MNVFWGVELNPGKPHRHRADPYDYTKLHLSQATLGLDVYTKERVVVKCQVGDQDEILLCSLVPGVSESSSLDLLFDQDVVFSVTGSASVHLTGYYMPLVDDTDEEDGDYDTDEMSMDEDDGSGSSEDYSSDEDSEEELVPPSSSVKIEEIFDEGPGEDSKDLERPGSKKRKQALAITNGNKGTPVSKKDIVVNLNEDEESEESEDEDGFVLPKKKKKVASDTAKASAVEAKAAVEEGAKDSAKKKKKKADAAKAAKEVTVVAEVKASPAAAKVKATAEKPAVAKGAAAKQAEDKAGKIKKTQPRKYPNGLEIHEVAMGKPDGKQAKVGKRVSVIYTGRLKNGKVFDSNLNKKPFQFRLGVGEVIKGWDIGVEGMRVGDKRKLVIPPALGYEAEGVPNQIPGNATLTFDVELVDVK